MITAVCKDLTEASTFKDLTITNYTGEQLSMEDDLVRFVTQDMQTEDVVTEGNDDTDK